MNRTEIEAFRTQAAKHDALRDAGLIEPETLVIHRDLLMVLMV